MKQKIRALFLWVMILSLVLPNIAFASANTGIDHSANIEAAQATEEQIQTTEEQLPVVEEQLQTEEDQLPVSKKQYQITEEKLHLTEQYELTDEELEAYLAEHEPEAMPLEAPSTELEWMRYLSDAVKSALLNGDDTIDLAAYPYTRTTATQINFLDSYCPYTDRKDIQLRVYFNSQGKYAYISIENKKSAAATASWIQTVDAKLEHLMSLIADPALTAEDQMLILHDYMVSHYHYDTQYLGDSYNSGVMLTEWRGVCQAYATLFQYVMHRKGVECYITSNDGHAWNIVKIGNAYYHVDVTWDDPTEDEFGQVYHTFFLVNEEGIQVGGHENRDLTNLVCNSNTFATRYYKNAFSPVCINGNNRYYMSSGGLLCYNVANNVETVIDRLPYWYIWDTNVYYQVPFSGLFLYDGALYYNAPNSIRTYNLATGAVSTFATVDTTNGYVYGIFDADGLLYYTVGTEYDIPYYEKDIRTMALPTGHVHSFRQVSYEAPSCLAPGKIVSVCSICGEYREGLVPTVDHTFGPFEVVYDAMCYFPGEKKQTCTVCGTSRTEEIPAGHLYGSFVVTKAATCTEDGVRTSTCSRCGAKQTETIAALGHDYGSFVVTKAATCTEAGVRTKTCSRCGDKQTETIAKLSHEYATGYTVDVAATCTTAGSESRHCKNCSAKTGTRSIAALGHSYGSFVVTKAATCTEAGTRTKTCSRCGDKQTETIAKLSHEYASNYTVDVAATCTTAGSESRHCKNCTAKTGTRSIAALGHSYGSFVVTKAATCTEAGVRTKTCSRCGDKQTETIAKLSHEYASNYTVDVAATCTSAGSESRHCKNCSATTGTRSIAALGHSYGSFVVTKAATCTATGTRTKTCSHCGDKQTETIAKLAHEYASNYTVDVAATCTTAGSESRHCKNCSATTGTRSIAALGHSYGSYQSDTNNHWKVCSVCKEIAEKAPHAGGEATTTSKAKCDTCGREYGSKLPSVDPIETPDVSDIFTDVPKNAWYHDSVQYVYDNGIMTGMKDTIFAPANNLSRSQFAMILYRLAGSPTASFSPRFKDVKAGQWYTEAVMWASEVGVITGYNDGTFGPAKNITREQIAIMLYRFDQKVNGNNSQIEDPSEILNSFSDGKKVSSFAREGFAWAVQNGIITGREKDGIKTLMPQNNASRAEAATMIMRYLQ